MDHDKEERADLLPPSGSNDGPFPAVAPWSEAGGSSSSAILVEPLPTARRMRLGGTPGLIAGLLLGAALTAVLHHLYLHALRGHIVASQFWMRNSSNALSTLVQWLCMGSVSVSLTQLIWYLLRRRPFTILQLNHLFGLPDPLRILRLASSRRVWNAIPVIIVATILQAFALVSILAPNALQVGSSSPKNTTISVPTIYFNELTNHCNIFGETGTKKDLGLALQSETLIGWNAPAGCGVACNYTIQYAAPALRCTELAIDEVKTMLPVMQRMTSHQPMTVRHVYTVYNATPTNGGASKPLSMAWRTFESNGKSTFGGTRCLLYNTTQKSVVSFINNTGTISPSTTSYNNPVNADSKYQTSTEMCHDIKESSVSDTIYVLIWDFLFGQLSGAITRYSEYNNGTVTLPVTFDRKDAVNFATSNVFLVNETAGTFTPKSENISSTLEQILVNVTVALITYWGQPTEVSASVAQDQLVWVYHIQSLWITYATALAVTAACGAVGLACILENGEDSDLTFWDIVRATRNSELDVVVEGERSGDTGKDTILQYTGQGMDPEANTSGVFVLAMHCPTGSN
ncbi:hypothetical protein EDD18DRAFT_1129500 [Armillaria luteobubalina]|uniref:Uncharacterized protein n=1 Tax=Armillaria luteobubalina TaxID=153913 RepID=A0AA39QM35_9AGAR|nr:hypothetical protein EDD18DRAFT_1129500 [Armillaria luteobubalina]